MTALMRAAYHGHAQMVRALLDHGADPNITRNDKFTALALAAFFGHTETVRILLEQGARREVVTRCGASAHLWATARTFTDAARCLEAPVPPPPVRAPVNPVAPVVVKTLKDPPEIWDLVHEVRPSFNAGSAFMARVKSMNRFVAIGAVAVLILSVGSLGVLLLRGSRARNPQPVAEIPVIQNVPVVNVPAEIPRTETPVSEPEPVVVESNHPRNVTRQIRARSVAARSEAPEVVQRTESREPAAVVSPPVAAAPKFAAQPPVKKAPNVPSPQLITPTKAKVIQWP